MDLVRNSRGEWCVAVPAERYGYGAATGTRVLKRIPVPRCATREEARKAARSQLGLEVS